MRYYQAWYYVPVVKEPFDKKKEFVKIDRDKNFALINSTSNNLNKISSLLKLHSQAKKKL